VRVNEQLTTTCPIVCTALCYDSSICNVVVSEGIMRDLAMDQACSPLSTEIIAICSLLGSWLGVKGAK
jgi:hypothetical protein